MYVRRISRKRSDGSRVDYLQLAHKVRDPETGQPRDQILHHFGRADQLDQAQIKRLIRSLGRFLEPEQRASAEAELAGKGAELHVERSLSFGGSYVLDALWRRLGIQAVLMRLLDDSQHEIDVERLIFAMVANRALAPRSKLALERWVGRKAHIEGLDSVASQQLYRAMDLLVEHHADVQREVYFSVSSLLNLEVDLLFFDTTSTYADIEQPDDFRKFGHTKDHRPDRPQIVIGLAVTRGGIPVRCWVLPGNTNDASMVEQVQADLAGWRLNRVVWAMDRGMAGEAQRLALQRGGGHVIFGEKLRGSNQTQHPALSRAGRFKTVRDNLEVKEVTIEEGSLTRRYVVVRNPKQVVRDVAKRAQIVARIEEELEVVNRGIRKAGRHTKRACKLKSHRLMGRFIRELKSGELRLDKAALKSDAGLDGKYLLSTTDMSLSAEDVALGYKQLIDVERAFRTLKHTLDLRPLYHRVQRRIHAHVLLCWLALLLVRVIEREIDRTWEAAREELEDVFLTILRGKDGQVGVCTDLRTEQRKLLKLMNIPVPKRIQSIH